MAVKSRDTEMHDMVTRKNYLRVASLVALAFVGGLFVLQSCKQETLDLSQNFYPGLTAQEKCQFSFYNWHDTHQVDFSLNCEEQGMVTLRAVNQEILFRAFLEKGIDQDLSIMVPTELDRVLIEYGERVEYLSLVNGDIAQFFEE
ncbi:MAG: hypothetical protein MK081_04520 [Flavobacteriales bacterium]|nr:hypothetical protein [Flavobacteriales bacterium]